MFVQRTIGSLLLLAPLALATAPAQAQHAYLDDANSSPPPSSPPSISHHLFPRTMVHEMKSSVTNEAYSKYHVITVTGYDLNRVANVQAISPGTQFLRHISGRAYQGYTGSFCHISQGIAFETTGPRTQGGPSSAGCSIYAGHWLYRAGTPLTQSINATTKTLKVANANRIATGQYVVIYDAPAGSFNNAEHALVTGRNLSTNTITLAARGYKSTPKSHAAGAIVAQHVLGQGANNKLWAFNFSSVSPRDADNKTFGQAYADWLKVNYNRRASGQTPAGTVHGIIFDADFYYDLGSKASDHNNDLTTDNGRSNSGVNWLGQGLDAFYARLRNHLPNKIILGGVHDARGYTSLQGTQMENFPDFGNGDFNPNPKYKNLPSQMTTYFYNMGERGIGAPNSHNLTKTPTKAYPGNTSASSNKHMRFTMGLTALDDGYVGTHSAHVPDAWWDEFAVDVQPGSANYGKAINKNNAAAVRQHRGWLGSPLGGFTRVYNSNAFGANQSLVSGGTFNSNLNGWTSTNVNISRDTSVKLDGAGALRASQHNNYASSFGGATIKSPNVSLSAGQEYTIVFSARASKDREIRVAAGTESEKFPVSTRWRRYVMTWKQTSNQNKKVSFNVGHENTVVWLDTVYVFQGSADVFRRDFENGIVLVNASEGSKTINLGGQFQRINGTQDAVNNGNTVTSVTLGARDALFLVRPEDEQQTGGGPGPGTASVGNFVWDDADSDGIQDAGESGRGGVTVRLRECGGAVVSATQTSASGAYQFQELSAGTYEVEFVNPTGTVFSPRGQTTGGKDSDPDPATGLSECFNLADGQNRPGVDAGLITQGGGGGGGGGGNVACKKPNNYSPATVEGFFVWKNCNTGTWFVRATAGGSTTAVRATGNLTSSHSMSGIGKYLLEEPQDTFIRSGDRKRIDFDFFIYNDGEDGFSFNVNANATKACITLPTGGPIYLGQGAAVYQSPLNLLNPGALCQ